VLRGCSVRRLLLQLPMLLPMLLHVTRWSLTHLLPRLHVPSSGPDTSQQKEGERKQRARSLLPAGGGGERVAGGC
jgi:hypothetical protein